MVDAAVWCLENDSEFIIYLLAFFLGGGGGGVYVFF